VFGTSSRWIPALFLAGALVSQGLSNVSRFLHSDFQFFAGMRRLMSLFFDSIVDDTPVPIPYRDILRISQLMDEIFRQVREQTLAAQGTP